VILSRLRFVTGVAILAALALFGAILLPVYWRNYQFTQSLDGIALEGRQYPDEWVRTAVSRSASALRLPVTPDHVRLRRSDGRLEVQVPYTVSVDFSIYAVDLHFRPDVRK
jgi:hypothetical protein